jgi:acetate kinase
MKPGLPCVLTINGGSSSLRFAIYEMSETLPLRLHGKLERIGVSGTRLTATAWAARAPLALPPLQLTRGNHHAAIRALLGWIGTQPLSAALAAVGHRVVHGMRHNEPQRVTPKLLTELQRITPYAPEHLPQQIALIGAFRRRFPRLPQIACFDTAFHRTLPAVARRLPLPRRFAAKGVERYGFHGLSCAYLLEELTRLDAAAARGRVIIAHLGNGASLTAVQNGRSIDTSMGFTPAAGLMMGTRSGDLDPGLYYYLARSEHLSPAAIQKLLNREAGLRGVSASGADVRDLLAREATDVRAAEALALFCYQARKWLGAYAATLGGVETIVFSGGIGENAAPIRARICEGLGFLGIQLDARRNARNAAVISAPGARVTLRVIRTDEQRMIARSVMRTLKPD